MQICDTVHHNKLSANHIERNNLYNREPDYNRDSLIEQPQVTTTSKPNYNYKTTLYINIAMDLDI